MLVLLVLAAVPSFSIDAGAATARELADLRCQGHANELTDGGTTFACRGEDLTDALWRSELVVMGTVTKVAPRITIDVQRTLKGTPTKKLTVEAPTTVRVSKGDRAVWLLMRGLQKLELGQRVDARSPDIENYIASLAAEATCPAQPDGVCFTAGAQCFTKTQDCACELPCQGGAPPDPSVERIATWVCRPKGCADARVNARCSREGLTCSGCWGLSPWRCEHGRWRYTETSPPP